MAFNYIIYLSKKLLKVSLYKHHYLSILINIFLSIILFIIFLIRNQNYFQFFIFSTFYILSECLFAISLCIEYYIYNNFIISAYLILGLQGTIGFSFIILEEIIRMSINQQMSFILILKFKEKYIHNIISIILYCVVYICYLMLVIKNSPAIIGVIDCLEIIILTLLKPKGENKWIKMSVALIFMILLMIFCEMIVLNFYDLNKDIKNNIQKRAQEILSFSNLSAISESESSSIEEEN